MRMGRPCSPNLIRRKPLKHDMLFCHRVGACREGIGRMTVCVAAIAEAKSCVVCIADKALLYGDYIQWDSDCTKIFDLKGDAVAMLSSDNEAHATRLLSELMLMPFFRINRNVLIKAIENSFKAAFRSIQAAEVLGPEMLTEGQYLTLISSPELNLHALEIAKKVSNFELACDALICGHDDHDLPYILGVRSPGVVTDYSNVGFHAVGSGAEKAISQLLFCEHKRTYGIARTLYECFDAKAHAEMAVGVGYEWDACLVTELGAKLLADEAKPLIDRVWSRANRSPFQRQRQKDDLPNPPRDWEDKLNTMIEKSLNFDALLKGSAADDDQSKSSAA
jgi:hypothetical protein